MQCRQVSARRLANCCWLMIRGSEFVSMKDSSILDIFEPMMCRGKTISETGRICFGKRSLLLGNRHYAQKISAKYFVTASVSVPYFVSNSSVTLLTHC